MKDDTPLLSVIMGVYYRRPDLYLLRRSVDSILAQTEPRFEFLICDDGSTPEAMTCLDEYARMDERIRILRSGDLFSLPAKLNACLREAGCRLIARMDDDDYSYPQRFEKQLAFLDRHPEVSFCGCPVRLVQGSELKPVGCWRFPEFPKVSDFYMTQPFIHPSLVFRRDCLEDINGYSVGRFQELCEDYDLLLRLYEKGHPGANLQEILLDYRLPDLPGGNRRMKHRWNECVTRFQRYHALGILPKALPFVAKPILTGLIPAKLLSRIKARHISGQPED